jgi:hypothetical protein
MARKRPFSLIYDSDVKRHLEAIPPKYDSLIRSSITEQLQFEPDTETTNRKPLRPTALFEADWELRFGPDNRFRAFYRIDPDRREVHIVAIGVKRGNRLSIGGEEVTL